MLAVAVPLLAPQVAAVPVAVADTLQGMGTVMLKEVLPVATVGQPLSVALMETV